MFSQTLRRFANLLSPNKQLPIRLCSTVFEPQTARAVASHNIHNINVTGKVLNIYNFENGTMTFYIKSVCPGGFYKMHKVLLTQRNAVLLDMMKTNLALEQKVHIAGKLNTSRFQTYDGKHRSTSAIMATQVFIFSDGAVAKDSKHASTTETAPNEVAVPEPVIDENSVELSGTITTGISGGDQFKSFTLGTLKVPHLSRTDPKNVSFNRIFVYDKSLFPTLNGVRVKRDEILVRGEISYRMYKEISGKTVTSSYIKATQIYRI
ncbi:uncharacterized protein LOC129577147 isoform X1 [Sitodiplosis mosellana]|uniref:uncharacterized protein LOC129577147 isoform X1 n=1 Tax=Sitodiplosis mosellana TaxID=263140 RepID=UPI002444A4AB|nr:uncharacterized protein LOC129577147 isoform X1 [Sitodiplosis mosellana]